MPEQPTAATPKADGTPAPATAATGESGVAVEPQDAVGRAAQGTEYGNPYDPTAPPYPVYVDPKRRAIERAEEELADNRAKNAKGTEYVFVGHQSPYEGTHTLVTENGTVTRGGTIKLGKELKESLEARGFVFDKATASDKSD